LLMTSFACHHSLMPETRNFLERCSCPPRHWRTLVLGASGDWAQYTAVLSVESWWWQLGACRELAHRCTCNGPKSFLLLDNRISSTANVFPEILCFVQWLQIVLFLCAMGRPTYLDLFSLQILLHLEFLPWYSGVIIFWKPYVNL
jgi:hypothetical protein